MRVGGSGLLVVRLLRLAISWEDWNSLAVLLEANVRRVKDWSQLPKIGAVLMPRVLGMRVDLLPVRA
jgi:hypothetical protein